MRERAWSWCGAALVLACAAMPAARAAEPSLPLQAGPWGAAVGPAVEKARGREFWGIALAARDGQIAYANSWGTADYERRPITLDTLFEIASASKQVTATAILKLEQQGKLKTSQTLDALLKDVPEDKHAVTVQHLLNHTAGLRDDLGVPYASTIARREYVRQMLAPPLATEPGTRFAYSNVGYALLAAIVEEVTGKTFEDYVRKELFSPAGLKRTGFINEPRLARDPDVTTRRSPEPGAWTAARWHWGWGYKGMGGVVSTANDLLAWDRALRGDKVLGPAAREKLFTPALEGYACGWRVETTERGTRRAHHSGGVAGFRCQVGRGIDEDALIVVLTNGENDPFGLEQAALRALFPPARLRASLHGLAAHRNEHGATVVTDGVAITAEKGPTGPRLRVRAGADALAEIDLTDGHLRKLLADLEEQAATRADEQGEARVEAGVYLNLYGVQSIELEEGLTLVVRPRYEGRAADGSPVRDERALLLLIDERRGGWPMMIKLNGPALRGVVAALRDALPAGAGTKR